MLVVAYANIYRCLAQGVNSPTQRKDGFKNAKPSVRVQRGGGILNVD